MLRSVFSKTLFDQRRGLLGWVIGFVAVTVMYAAFFPSLKGLGTDVLDAYPEAMREALNLNDLTSGAGYLNSTVFGILGPVLMIVFAASVGARAIAGDEEGGTLELVLAHPVGRLSLLFQRFAALVVTMVFIAGMVFLGLLAINEPAELGIATTNLAAMCVSFALLGLVFGTLGMTLGALRGRRALVFAVTAVVGALGYVANAFFPLLEELEWAQKLSPMYYYAHGEPLRNGLQAQDAGVLLAATAVLMLIAALRFRSRDVTI